ncbi:MAG: GntR family transcriptional regulator [Gammaproteobacteria bacterium]
MAKGKRAWDDDLPIYRQIMDSVIGGILEGSYPEGEMLPSVRQLATEYGVSPLTAAKVFSELSRDNVVDKQIGIGFSVRKGVRQILLNRERRKFLDKEWPKLRNRLERLEIDISDLLGQ